MVQSIFRTKFCPGLGLFLISLREKNAPCSPGPAPVLSYFVLKFDPVENMSWSNLFLENFAPVLGYLKNEKCPVEPKTGASSPSWLVLHSSGFE